MAYWERRLAETLELKARWAPMIIKAEVGVDGMFEGFEAYGVTRSRQRLDGDVDTKEDLERELITVTFRPGSHPNPEGVAQGRARH